LSNLVLYIPPLSCLSADTHTCTQPFYGSLDFVWDNPGELVPEETFTRLPYRGHQSPLICFLHLLRSMASSLFNLHAWQSFSTSFLWSTSWPGTQVPTEDISNYLSTTKNQHAV